MSSRGGRTHNGSWFGPAITEQIRVKVTAPEGAAQPLPGQINQASKNDFRAKDQTISSAVSINLLDLLPRSKTFSLLLSEEK